MKISGLKMRSFIILLLSLLVQWNVFSNDSNKTKTQTIQINQNLKIVKMNQKVIYGKLIKIKSSQGVHRPLRVKIENKTKMGWYFKEIKKIKGIGIFTKNPVNQTYYFTIKNYRIKADPEANPTFVIQSKFLGAIELKLSEIWEISVAGSL